MIRTSVLALCLACHGIACLGLACLGAGTAVAADAALIAAAKKDGEVTWYTTAIVDQFVRPMAAAFEARYGIKVTYVRAGPAEISLRVVNEARAGRVQADLVDGTTTPVLLRGQQMIEKWTPPVDLPPRYVDPDGYWAASNEYVLTPGFNTDLVPPGTEPTTWQDLLDPKWTGKLAWNANPVSSGGAGFVGTVIMEWGEARARSYFAQLARQNVAGVKSTARQVLDQVIAGEFPVALHIFNNHATISKSRGAPVSWAKMEPALALVAPVSLTRGAPHFSAAKLFFEFLLSDEGQRIVAQAGELPVSPHVSPLVPELRPDAGHFRAIYLTPEKLQAEMPGWAKIFDEYFR